MALVVVARLLLGAVLLVLSAAYMPSAAHAATITWGGGGATKNWSDCANWVGGSCPGSGDSVVFNNTSTKDSIIDSSAPSTIYGFSINTGYTGTIVQQRDMTINTSFTQAAGTFDQGTSGLTMWSGSLIVSGGVVNAGAGTTAFMNGQSFNSTGSTYNASSTRVMQFPDIYSGSVFTCTGTFPGTVSVTGNGGLTVGAGCTINTADTTGTAGGGTHPVFAVNGTVHFGTTVVLGGLTINNGGTVTTSGTTHVVLW